MAKVTLDNLGAAVEKILDEYEADVLKGLSGATAEVAKAGAAAVRTNARATFGGTGAYARGWSSKTTTTRIGADAVIYNRTEYRLSHLLENGHALKRGGRTIGRGFVQGRAHIEPVEEEINARYEKAVKDII